MSATTVPHLPSYFRAKPTTKAKSTASSVGLATFPYSGRCAKRSGRRSRPHPSNSSPRQDRKRQASTAQAIRCRFDPPAQPYPDECQLGEHEVVGCKLVMAGCDWPTLLQLLKNRSTKLRARSGTQSQRAMAQRPFGRDPRKSGLVVLTLSFIGPDPTGLEPFDAGCGGN
jgi:hypothetical protein